MFRTVGLGLLLLAMAGPVFAGRWQFSKGLSINTDASNNIGLNTIEQESDTVLRVRPSLGARRSGGRAKARIAYAPEFRYYVSGSEDHRVRHILRADADAELIEEIFFLRMNARADQVLIDPGANAAGFDSVADPDAFTQAFSFRIIPDIRVPVLRSDFARVRIRPGINYTFTAESADRQDGLSRGGSRSQVNFTSGSYFSRMPWSLNYRNDVFDADTRDSWGRADGTIGYRFSARYRIDFSVGYDSAKIDSGRDGSGFRWRVTGGWNPSSRTSLALGIGEAFFGDDWILRFRHRHKHTSFSASYDVNIENAASELQTLDVVPFEDELGNEIADPLTGEQLFETVTTPILIDDVYLRERFIASIGHARGRTSGTLRLHYDTRDYDGSNRDTEELRLYLTVRRRLGPRTSGNIRVDYWDYREDDPDAQDFEQVAAQLGFRYRLGPNTNVGLNYRYTDRNSSVPARDYNEGRFNLNLSFNL